MTVANQQTDELKTSGALKQRLLCQKCDKLKLAKCMCGPGAGGEETKEEAESESSGNLSDSIEAPQYVGSSLMDDANIDSIQSNNDELYSSKLEYNLAQIDKKIGEKDPLDSIQAKGSTFFQAPEDDNDMKDVLDLDCLQAKRN